MKSIEIESYSDMEVALFKKFSTIGSTKEREPEDDIPTYVDCILGKLFEEFKSNAQPIRVDFRKLVYWIPYSDSYTHYIHPYPAKLLKHIPIFFLNSKALLPKKGSTVLDPFCGSGTVLLESILHDQNAIGTDSNPLAQLIAQVKTTPISQEKLAPYVKTIIAKAKKYRKRPGRNITNIDHWFPKKSQQRLENVYRAIETITDKEVRDFFKVTFSSIVKRASFADPNLSVPVKINPNKYRDKKLRERAQEQIDQVSLLDVYVLFEKYARINIERIDSLNRVNTSKKAQIVGSDARKINSTEPNGKELRPDCSVDLIITSPPYAGAQKYIRSSSLNLGWLNYCETNTLRDFERQNIGREHYSVREYHELKQLGHKAIDSMLQKIAEKNRLRAHISGNYLLEMDKALQEMYRVLRKKGYCVLVIGNNEVCGYKFETQMYVRILAEKIGFETKLVLIDDIRSRGLMTKRNKTASVIHNEWVLVLKK